MSAWTKEQRAKYRKTMKAKRATTSIPLDAIPERAAPQPRKDKPANAKMQIVLELLRTIQEILK